MKTQQEVFNYVVDFMRKQGKPASGGICVYLTDAGLMCAVGCMLPKDVAMKHANAGSINGIVSDVRGGGESLQELPQALWAFLGGEPAPLREVLDGLRDWMPLLTSLQLAHDDASTASNFLRSFLSGCKEIAVKYGLEMPA